MTNTRWAEVITDYAMLYIDDIRLEEELNLSPALFLRRMSLFVNSAIPMLNRPPELLKKLHTDLTAPLYDDFEWTSTEASVMGETQVETNMFGYDIVSCVTREVKSNGEVVFTPYPFVDYNPDTGVVTFPEQNQADVEYQLDFYSDGQFGYEMTVSQKRLLGLAIACVWDERFSRNWLNMQPKIKDQSFDVGNESNHINANRNRLLANMQSFTDELRKYEQDCAYYETMNASVGTKTLI